MLGRAIRDFLRDLFAGDPVALGLVCGFLCFLFVLGAAGLVIVLNKRKRDAEFRRRKEIRDKQEDERYRKM
jgi:hypothetical protein